MLAGRSGCASSPPSSTWSAAAGRSGSRPVERVGVLGSAFNPPHFGHLALAQEAAWACGLDRVLFVPTGVAPHKQIEDDPGAEARLEMVELAVRDVPDFEASPLEVKREGVSYTYRTLEQLVDGDPELEIYLLMGADAALGLPKWKKSNRIVELARPVVAHRNGIDEGSLRDALSAIGAWEAARLIDLPPFGVSSSLIRQRSNARMPLRYLVPDSVAAMIAERSLYRDGGG